MSRSVSVISLAVLVVCCFLLVAPQQTVFAQLGGQLVSLVSTQSSDANTSLVSMSLPQFTIQSTQSTPIKSHYIHPSSVNRKNDLIHMYADYVLYTIDRKSLAIKQRIPFDKEIVKMEYNPKGDNLITFLVIDHRYFLASVSPNNGQTTYIMELDRKLNQTFIPTINSGYTAYDFNRNIFYLSVNDGAWIPGHNRILKFDINNEKISAIVMEDELSEFGDFDYDATLDLVIGVYYPVSSDGKVQFITIDAHSKVERFSVQGTDLNSNYISSYSSLNGYYYLLTNTGKAFVIDIKARKLILSTTNPISSKYKLMFGYYFE